MKQIQQKFFCPGGALVGSQEIVKIREGVPGDEAGRVSAFDSFQQRGARGNVRLTVESDINQNIGIEQNGQRYFFASD